MFMKVWFVDKKRMRRAMKAKGLTIKALAGHSGLAYDTVAKLLYGNYPCEPMLRTKKALAGPLELSIEALFPLAREQAS